jgi:hypothetical protein
MPSQDTLPALTVVGGSYVERCCFPASANVYGSGLRAAAAVAKRGARIRLETFIGQSSRPDLEATAAIFGIELVAHDYPETFVFDYLHSLAPPIVHPAKAVDGIDPLRLAADCVLCFGMMEGNPVVNARAVVYDPQSPADPRPFHENGSTAERLAIVCNRREARRLSERNDLTEAGQRLLVDGRAEVVVIKDGARGALVFTSVDIERVPAFRTEPQSLVGSGDLFSGTFAYHWLIAGDSPVTAARMASQSTAFYCATQVLPVPLPLPASFALTEVAAGKPSRLVYLAGPFFTPQQLWMIEEARIHLEEQGLKVFSPFHDVGVGLAEYVAPADLAGLERSDLIFALLDGHDPGTLFEIGYARALKKPVIAFTALEEPKHLTMLHGSGCKVFHNYVAAIYAAAWAR